MRRLSSDDGIHLGTNLADGSRLTLSREWLKTHMQLEGTTGTGKTLMAYMLYEQLLPDDAAIIVINHKGDFGRYCRDGAAENGHAGRLLYWDLNPPPGEPFFTYNPARRNGLSVATHAKWMVDSFRCSMGQLDFAVTPQMNRALFGVFYATIEQNLTLAEAAELLRAGSPVRRAVLPLVRDPFVAEALRYIDRLGPGRQDELLASSLARLEAFLGDVAIRHMLTREGASLDVGVVMAERQILIADYRLYDPTPLADVQLLSRFLLNDVLAHAFNRKRDERVPVYVFIDEVELAATQMLTMGFDLAREAACYFIIANQYDEQFVGDDQSRKLLASVHHDVKTKLIFGGGWPTDLYPTAEYLFGDRWSPTLVKDELHSLEVEPVEVWRRVRSRTRSGSEGRGISWPKSTTDTDSWSEADGETDEWSESSSHGIAEADGTSTGTSRARSRGGGRSWEESRGEAVAHGRARTASHAATHAETDGYAETESDAVTDSDAVTETDSATTGSTYSATSDHGMATDPEGAVTYHTGSSAGGASSASAARATSETHGTAETHGTSTTRSRATTEATTDGTAATRSRTHTQQRSRSEGSDENWSDTDGESWGESSTTTESETETEGASHGQSHTATTGGSNARSRGVTPSRSSERGWSESVSQQPGVAYRKRRVVSSRTFLSLQEYLAVLVHKVIGQPVGHFVVKVPGKPAVFARAPFIEPPELGPEALARARDRMLARPTYATAIEVEEQHQARRQRLLLAGPTAAPYPDNNDGKLSFRARRR